MSAPHWSEHPRTLELRHRSAVANTVVRAAEHFRRHRTGRNAALVAHYGFLSVFPLMLVFTTVIGLVLEGHPHLRDSIIDSVFSRIPIIGDTVKNNPAGLTGSWWVLVIGLLTALWAALKAFNVLQMALDDIAEVGIDDRRNLVHTRLRSLVGIAVVGGAQIVAATLTVLVASSGIGWSSRSLLAAATIAVNIITLACTYRWLCSRPLSWRQVAPGAIAGGVAFSVLQYVGTAIVARAIAHASPVYGTFASVIGLITWLSLHATIALGGAEVNAVLPIRPLPRRAIVPG